MFKVNNKEARTTPMFSLFLTLSLTVPILLSLLLFLNIFHILHDVKYTEIRALYWKKKSKFNRLQIKMFFLPNIIRPPPYVIPSNIGQSNLSFVRIYAQGVLTGIYGIAIGWYLRLEEVQFLKFHLICNIFYRLVLDIVCTTHDDSILEMRG